MCISWRKDTRCTLNGWDSMNRTICGYIKTMSFDWHFWFVYFFSTCKKIYIYINIYQYISIYVYKRCDVFRPSQKSEDSTEQRNFSVLGPSTFRRRMYLYTLVVSFRVCFILFVHSICPTDFLHRFVFCCALSYREFCRIIGDLLAWFCEFCVVSSNHRWREKRPRSRVGRGMI